MAIAETFLVRVLIYGMVGFVPGANGTTILLPQAEGHKAYIAFEGDCSGQCEVIRPFHSSFPGFELRGDQILVGSVAIADRAQTSIDSPRALGNLPENQDEAVSFFWVPTMSNILRTHNTGQIDPNCMKADPSACRLPIAGRAHFSAGQKLTTCQLVSRKGFVQGDKIFAFDFKNGDAGSVKQGLAEVVELLVRVEGSEIPLKLVPFPSGTPRQVTLKPRP